MSTDQCIKREVIFIVKEDDPEMQAVESYIVEDLAKIGITVKTQIVDSETYIERERSGEYNLLFSRTWGSPYDPHTYLNSWEVPSHVEYSAIDGFEPPLTREALLDDIDRVQQTLVESEIQAQWKTILNDIHQQAIFLPLWGTRIPYVINRRLGGFTPSPQTYSYPIAGLKVLEGSNNVTVAPGAGGSLFKSIGPMNPHQYFPNQLFAQSWIYEGLVYYGQDGDLEAALATNWTVEELPSGGQRATFDLRKNTKFHDGSDWNCAVAKLNFDHVLSDTVKQRHAWFGLTSLLTSWTCNDEGQFVLETSTKFYPLVQELSYIRPLTFASAEAFAEGLDSDPDLHNSCNAGDFGDKWDHLEKDVTCLGLSAPIGTGPFRFVSREFKEGSDEAIDERVLFQGFEDYWGGPPEIDFLEVLHFESKEAIEEALLDQTLDMALGIGPLSAQQVQDLKFKVESSNILDVRHSDVLQNANLVMNTNRTPTDDIEVRKAIIHAVDKGRFLEAEFAGLEQPVTQLLPYSAPYSNVDLNPKWSYDLAKAQFINCPTSSGDDGLSSGAIAGITISAAFAAGLLVFVIFLVMREKDGKPMFTPTPAADEKETEDEKKEREIE